MNSICFCLTQPPRARHSQRTPSMSCVCCTAVEVAVLVGLLGRAKVHCGHQTTHRSRHMRVQCFAAGLHTLYGLLSSSSFACRFACHCRSDRIILPACARLTAVTSSLLPCLAVPTIDASGWALCLMFHFLEPICKQKAQNV